ncbi:MAG: hypothetical protein HUJ59_01220 [Bacilli bacterium]|nr:hypothetical protein [Bacilli bacterium]
MAGTSCMFWLNLAEIPLGILLGCGTGIISYVIFGFISIKEKEGAKPVGSIAVTIVRFLLIAVVIFLSAWLYYNQGIKLFNVFAVAGGYAIPLLVLTLIVTMKGGKRGNVR